jgi:hypothetical protein
MWVTTLLLLLAAGQWLYQGAMWLHDGYWTPLPFELIWRYGGLAYPDFQWKAVQIITAGVLNLPIPLVAFVLACLVVWPEAKIETALSRWRSSRAVRSSVVSTSVFRKPSKSTRDREHEIVMHTARPLESRETILAGRGAEGLQPADGDRSEGEG